MRRDASHRRADRLCADRRSSVSYEIHGRGKPLVLLHGAYLTIELMGPILPALAKTREVIAVELQGHGHTADVERPLTYEQMAGDTAALVRTLDVDQTPLVRARALSLVFRRVDRARTDRERTHV